MGAEYDQKFEEMKKYIPFLDGMIKRLEANSKVTGNPRQAQLDKIKSLRDLLSVKKKRLLDYYRILNDLRRYKTHASGISGFEE